MSEAGLWQRFRARVRTRVGGKQAGRGRRSSAGAAEVSVVIVAGALVAGVFFGDGLSRTAVDIADGLTWLSDDPSGEVIQVNPATGRVEQRMQAGAPGDDIEVAQYDGRLVIINHSTGEITSVDLSTSLTTGQVRGPRGESVETLAHDNSIFVVDREQDTVARVDPVTFDPIGTLFVAEEGLADAAIDGRGHLYTIDETGRLSDLRWSDTSSEFITEDSQDINNSGPESLLVGHEKGVTVFGLDEGFVLQSGTGHDVLEDQIDFLSGKGAAPLSSPADLVPVSASETGRVFILAGDQLRSVDVKGIGCEKPARPEVFHETVFVPCPGDGKVVRLGEDGQRDGSDISTPEGKDPELVLDDNRLIINVPGAKNGIVVNEDGSTRTIIRYDDEVEDNPIGTGATTPTGTQPTLPTYPPFADPGTNPGGSPDQGDQDPDDQDPDSGDDNDGDQPGPGDPTETCDEDDDWDDWDNQGGDCTGTDGPGDGDGPGPECNPLEDPDCIDPDTETPGECDTADTTCTTEPLPECPGDPRCPGEGDTAPGAPTSVTAEAAAEGQVTLRWTHTAAKPDSFVLQVYGGETLQTVSGGSSQATVNVEVGTSAQFVVAAKYGSRSYVSQPSNTITASGRPGAPGSVTGQVDAFGYQETGASVQIKWTEAADNGSPITAYTVIVTGGEPSMTQTQTVPAGTRQVSFTLPCTDAGGMCYPGLVQATVHATNAVGDGPPAQGNISQAPEPAGTLPAGGQQIATWANTSLIDDDGTGSTTISLRPPADWAAFRGNCEWVHSGNAGGQVRQSYPCAARSLTLVINHGRIQGDGHGTGIASRNHSITFYASNESGKATSRSFGWTEHQEEYVPEPSTPSPSNPPNTPGPTNPPNTPGPTNPPNTPGPSNPPNTPGPTNPPSPTPTGRIGSLLSVAPADYTPFRIVLTGTDFFPRSL